MEPVSFVRLAIQAFVTVRHYTKVETQKNFIVCLCFYLFIKGFLGIDIFAWDPATEADPLADFNLSKLYSELTKKHFLSLTDVRVRVEGLLKNK